MLSLWLGEGGIGPRRSAAGDEPWPILRPGAAAGWQ